MQSRRNFLRSGVMTALSVSLAIGSGRMILGQQKSQGKGSNVAVDFPIPAEARQETLFNYNQAAFESYLGSTFTATGATGRIVELKLVRVTGYTADPKTKITTAARESECFKLSFDSSGPLPLFTSIHRLHHDALGDIDLFLVEQKTESGDLSYEAVINHAGASPQRPIFRRDESPRLPAKDSESPL